MSRNLSELSARKGLKDNLFDRYGQLIQEDPRPGKESLEKLAEEFLIGTANVKGAITFYDFLKPENQNKKVYICNGSVCLCAGTQGELKEKLLEHFREDEIGKMCCLGRCHENHAFHYNGHNYSGPLNGQLGALLEKARGVKERVSVKQLGKAILTEREFTADDLQEVIKVLLSRNPASVLDEIDRSRLRGRGGAGFPIAVKLKTCAAQDSKEKFIICNADEGDPGAFSDKYLLEEQPWMVLCGMIIAGYVVGADWGIVYIRGEYPESVKRIQKCVSTLEDYGILGEKVFGGKFHFRIKIIEARGSYICGEETALINSIEGQRPEVRIRPPYPAEQGLFNRPTIVNNVETLAFLPAILTQGGHWFSQIGTKESTGTKLMCLDSRFKHPGLVEVEMGTPFSEVVYKSGSGFIEEVKALHVGGPLGGLVPVDLIEKLTVDFESFQNEGFLLGHASVVSIPAAFPMVTYLEHLFEFASDESCGKCFPCRLGTKRAQEMFHKAFHSGYRINRTLIDDLLHTLEIGSLCAHGGGIPLPVRNALTYFQDELEPYFESTGKNLSSTNK